MAKSKIKDVSPIKLKIRIPHVILDLRNADLSEIDGLEDAVEHVDARVKVIGEGLGALPHVFSLEEALEEAHLWVILSEEAPKELNLLAERGIVPVMLSGLHPYAENYDPVKETGNAFLFSKMTPWHVYGSLVRALENFNFSYDWENIRNHGKTLLESSKK